MAQPARVPRRVLKIADEIARLPIDLHDSILQQLRFTDVVYLSLAAAAFPVLLASIQHGPAWRWLLEDSLEDIQDIWNTLDGFSWVLSGRSWLISPLDHQGLSLLRNLKITSAEAKAIFTRIEDMEEFASLELSSGKTMVLHLQKVLLARLQISFGHYWPPRENYRDMSAITWADRRGIAMFIPEPARQAIINGDSLPESWHSTEPWQELLTNAPNDETISQCAAALPKYFATMEGALSMAPVIHRSLVSLRAAQNSELLRMKDLYNAHPTLLKKPLAPQSPRKNHRHILQNLKRDAKHALARPFCLCDGQETRPSVHAGWYRFRNQLPLMVPYDWCMSLFDLIVKRLGPGDSEEERIKGAFPAAILTHLQTAQRGLPYLYEHSDSNQEAPRPRVISRAPGDVCYRLDSGDISGCPRPVAEMEWLESFLVCVSWMAGAFPEDAQRLQQTFERSALCMNFKRSNTVLSGSDFAELVQKADPEELAKWLQLDSKTCDKLADGDKGTLPSLLAFYMPPYPAPRAKMVARHMVPGEKEASPALRQMLYEQAVEKIVGYLSRPPSDDESGHETARNLLEELNIETPEVEETEVDDEWKEALKAYQDARRAKERKQEASKPSPRLCYICRFTIDEPHPKFTSMCIPCGEFNLAGSKFALRDVAGETALVTGGRVNLGFHVALQLLREGVNVIITTRYPQDALQRFQGEVDHKSWIKRLTILGADFRCGADVFEVVRLVKKALEEKKKDDYWVPKPRRLKFLINNAAQTLTDSVSKEQQAIERETKLLLEEKEAGWNSDGNKHHPVGRSTYRPRVRGGMQPQLEGSTPEAPAAIKNGDASSTDQAVITKTGEEAPRPSSWAQSLSEIPYDDVISAHSVNTFTPLILIRELAPLMIGRGYGGTYEAPSYDGTPIAHIVNVSSREGIFEDYRNSRSKRGKHVHTNMSKAGLNMITETEAATLWKEKRIAMNTVDPGYMSAAPECEEDFGGERPLGWEDGAGRVLWPIHRMEKAYRAGRGHGSSKQPDRGWETEKYWGRFFKHYGAVRVDPRFGRG